MSIPIAGQPVPTHRHRLLWLVTVILALLIGYSVGRRSTPICVASRSHVSGPSASRSVDSESPSSPASETGDVDLGSLARQYAASPGGLGPAAPDSASQSAHGTTLSATDFSYDATGLPLYPTGVTRVASARTTHRDEPTDTGSTVVILTADSFNDVVAWYHEQVPATWHQGGSGNVEKLPAQLSPQGIAQLLTAIRGDGLTSTAVSVDTTAAGGPDTGTSIAVWHAPSDGRAAFAGVMVIARSGNLTEIILKRRVGT